MNELIGNLVKLQSLEFDETVDAGKEKRIAELRAKIPMQILGHYDRLVARGKKGLAVVRNHVCTGCHMQVPLGAVMTLMRGDDIQLCECCGRYLYLSDQGKTGNPPAPVKKAKTESKREAQPHHV